MKIMQFPDKPLEIFVSVLKLMDGEPWVCHPKHGWARVNKTSGRIPNSGTLVCHTVTVDHDGKNPIAYLEPPVGYLPEDEQRRVKA